MTNELTDKQEIVLDIVKGYIQEHGYSPTVRELCEILGLKSPATVHFHLKRLKKKGYIDYIYNRNRTIKVLNERIK